MQVQERMKSQPPVEKTEGVLAQQAPAGDQDAFEKLVQRYSRAFSSYE